VQRGSCGRFSYGLCGAEGGAQCACPAALLSASGEFRKSRREKIFSRHFEKNGRHSFALLCRPVPGRGRILLHEHEEYGQNKADKGGQVVPVERLALEQDGGEHGKHNQGDDFLYDLELHQREGAAVAYKADAVGRNLAGIFGQRNAPRKEDDAKQGPVVNLVHFLKLEVAVPGKGHENVGYNQ